MMNKNNRTEELDDLKGFKKPHSTNGFPNCPARWILHSRKGMCENCNLNRNGMQSGVKNGQCGLGHHTIDHAHRVVEPDGKTRHFIAYPYDLNLSDLEDIVKMCETHGLSVKLDYVPGAHATAMRLDFYCDKCGIW